MSRILPILFNSTEVRATLEERMTVVRRICKDANEYTVPDMSFYDAEKRTYAVHNYANKEHTDKLSVAERICPICPDDILYVKETWCDDRQFTHDSTPGRYFYRASEKDDFTTKWRSSVQMPKEVARLFLHVKNVRVERLQDISPDDAVKEGTKETFPPLAVDEFRDIWNSTIKKSDLDRYGWDASPWVWVIEYERCEEPADY